MGLFKDKRSGIYRFDFWFQRQRFQGTTHLRNQEKAKIWLNKYKTDLAMGLVGMTNREPPPILSVFLEGLFLDNVRQNITKPRTIKFYEENVKRLCRYQPFTLLRLDKIDEMTIQGYKDSRLAKELSPATINGELRTLRKAMIYADRCGLIHYRKARYSLPGERHRMFVLDGEMETKFLAACDYPLRQVAILMLDLGLRPEECVSLRKSDISRESVAVRSGKTAYATRAIPQTARSCTCIEFVSALFPDSEWLFPGSKGNHFTRGAIDNLFTKVRKANKFPDEFTLYACRHTMATRLAESGASVFDIKTILGHSSVKVSERYIHPSANAVSLAMKRKEAFDKMLRGEAQEDTSNLTLNRE